MRVLFRVQDYEGRGPYRPGFSSVWTDELHAARNPTFFDEFGADCIARLPALNGSIGCAFDSLDKAALWFSPTERARLERHGYVLGRINPDRVFYRSARQVVFFRRQPFTVGFEPVGFDALEAA